MTGSVAATGCIGTVKWFSNKKGFGFIAPTSDNTPSKDEIFVHQTAIVTDGQFRTLQENKEVKYDVEKEDETGKLKAVNVTNTDGSPIVPPPRQPRKPRNKPAAESGDGAAPAEGNNGAAPAADAAPENKEAPAEKKGGRNKKGKKPRNNNNGDAAAAPAEGGDAAPAPTPRDPPFHAKFSDELKTQIETKTGLQLLPNKTTVDVALGETTRIKLGQGGYAGLCMSTAVIGEGKYDCTELGVVRFSWERSLKYDTDAGDWEKADEGDLLNTFSLLDDSVGPVKPDETAATLWGDKKDPKEAFEANGFQMRRVVLTRPPNSRFGRGKGGRGRNNKSKQDAPAE